ncbi:MAG: DegT/DnrJ/EryC1/StrS family aminotransferase [Nitrospinae bacterium]|nr:DegT/DnrJ/EryC1/StrS family aminotransferase [Nitrospinota bacterium]
MQRVLVTGGAGYLGSILSRRLVDKGYEVLCLDRLYFGDKPVALLLGHPNFQLVQANIVDIADHAELMEGVDAVIHLAGLAYDPSCDLDPATLNIDPEAIEAAITERTKAIIPVHMAGFPCDLDRIHAVAQGHGLAVVEDAAHALGAQYKGEKIGAISEFTCFSFYPVKNITTIEGGALATNNAEWAETARLYSLHGISRDAWKRYQPGGSLHWEALGAGVQVQHVRYPGLIGHPPASQARLIHRHEAPPRGAIPGGLCRPARDRDVFSGGQRRPSRPPPIHHRPQ